MLAEWDLQRCWQRYRRRRGDHIVVDPSSTQRKYGRSEQRVVGQLNRLGYTETLKMWSRFEQRLGVTGQSRQIGTSEPRILPACPTLG
jgi:hypothetical protein